MRNFPAPVAVPEEALPIESVSVGLPPTVVVSAANETAGLTAASDASLVHTPAQPGAAVDRVPPVDTSAAQFSASNSQSRSFGWQLDLGEVKRIVAGVSLLLLCGGPFRPIDGIEAFVAGLGATLVVYDTERSKDHDLCDEGRWAQIMADLEADTYGGVGACPPCSTFSGGRRNDGGPRPLRGEAPPELFGFAWLTPEEKESVRIGTLLAIRCEAACRFASTHGLPWWFETPKRRPGNASVFKLPVLIDLAASQGVDILAFVQCHLGAPTEADSNQAFGFVHGQLPNRVLS